MNLKQRESSPPISVLIVEDTESLLRLYSHILSQDGYTVYEAMTGADALALLNSERPDIVLLDRVLPDMDGSEICAHIKGSADLVSVYVIMLSALRTTEDDRVSGLESGADDYLVKPVGRRELLARVHVAARLKHAQQALEASEAMFRTLAENSPDIISRIDPEMRCIYVNNTVEEFSNRPASEYLGKSIMELHPEQTLVDCWREKLSEVFVSGNAGRIEFNLPSIKGMRVMDAHLVPEKDPDGTIKSILSVARDFTDHARAEQQIARLATVVEQALEAVVITDPRGAIVYANAAFQEITGIPDEELFGKRLQDMRDVYSAEFCDRFYSAVTSCTSWSGPTRCKRRVGHACIVEASVFPIKDRAGSIIDYAIIQRDVTERQRTEREREALLVVATALRKAETRAEMLPIVMEQIMEVLSVSSALFVSPDYDTDECVVEIACGECTDSVGARVRMHDASLPSFSKSAEVWVDNGDRQQEPNTMVQLLGHPRALAAVPLMAQNLLVGTIWVGSEEEICDQALGILLAIADMAATAIHSADLYEEIQRYAADLEHMVAERTQELATANEQLLELDRLKSKFVSNVSHELRTPISNLKLYVALLQRGKPERRAQYESMLRVSVERLGQLVEDILNLSRIEIAQQKMRTMERTDLNGVISQVVSLHQPQAEAAGVQLKFEPDPTLPLIGGDYNQLSQLATNLIANALNYTQEGVIRVSTQKMKDEDAISFVVEDTGIGILEEDLPHLFDRFYRGNHRQQDDIPGTGLGLAIVREIVDIHDGSIYVNSKVDEGTRIEVRLPVEEAPDELSVSWLRS